jgi:hypothetical protein
MANAGSVGILVHDDDPSNAIVSATEGTTITWAVSSDTSDTAIVRAVAAGKGLHYAGATYATDDNMIEFCSNNLNFSGQSGHSEAEVLLQLSDVTNIAFNFGFNDDVLDGGNTLPVELSGTTWTTTSSTFCGIVYDTDATNDELHVMWVDDDVDSVTPIATLRMKGMAPTAGKWLYMKVELDDMGSSAGGVRATFLAVDHTGKSVEKTFNTTVDRDCPLCFYLGVENRSASAHNVYIRKPNWKQTIADM